MSDRGGEWRRPDHTPGEQGPPGLPPTWLAAGGWASPGQPGAPLPGTEPLSTWALVIGIASFFVCPLLGGLTAIVIGARAKQAIDASGGRRQGRGQAVAGQVLGTASTVAWVVAGGIALALYALIPHPTPYTRLATGDCFNRTKAAVASRDVYKVPCQKSHLGEVVGTFDATGGPWPGAVGMRAMVGRRCDDDARAYSTSRPAGVGVYFLYPNERSWATGARRVVCELHNRDGSRRTGSVTTV